MKNKTYIFSGLIILIMGAIFFAVYTSQNKGVADAQFSGEWKAKASISMGGNIVCSYVEGDRMLAKTMKIEEQKDFLTIETTSESSGAKFAIRQEKLDFDGKECHINDGVDRGKKFTVKLSEDRKTMTINSVVHLMTATPYHVDVLRKSFVYVTEVWNLSKDGKSISVQTKAKSNIFVGGRTWTTVFEKVR